MLRETIAILEEKVGKSEAAVYENLKKNKKLLDDKNEELKVLKSVLNNHNDEIARLKLETKDDKKLFKSKEKEIYNLEKKSENQIHTNSNLKETNTCLKSENKILVKALDKAQKAARKDNNANVFAEPLPMYNCHICEETFQTKGALQIHLDSSNPLE